jgi:RNA polymerase sigma factor (sigma-70 family)
MLATGERDGREQGRDRLPRHGERSRRETFWEELARRQGHDLVRCVAGAMRRVGWRVDPVELDELVQEVYCRVLDGRFPDAVVEWPAAQLWAYLNRIARSVVVDAVRSRCARKRGGPPRGSCGRPAVDHRRRDRQPPATLAERRAPGPTPEERLLAREGARAVRRRVHELGGAEHGARNLRILELAAVEGCTAPEIARRLAGGLSASTVHTVLHRIRRQLLATPGPQLAAMVQG